MRRSTRGQKLAEWDPFTLPILTERSGGLEFADLIEGVTLYEETDPVTGLTSKVVRDPTDKARNANLRPRLLLRSEDAPVAAVLPAAVLGAERRERRDGEGRRRAGPAAA